MGSAFKDLVLYYAMDSDPETKALATTPSTGIATLNPAAAFGRPIVVPALVADFGPRAAKHFANFFGSIANDNTRAA